MMHPSKTRTPFETRAGHIVLLLSFFLLCYILPLGARPLVIPDETRYAEIPREMIAGGNWVVPRLNGLRYFEKPVLGYWVHAGAQLLLGENNFAVRLPSALAVGLSAWLIYLLVARLSRRDGEEGDFPAFLASLVFLSSCEVFAVGNTATLDCLFSFFVTASVTAFFWATETPPGSGREKGLLLLAGAACGLAFLTKGFLAFALPVLALAPYLVWQRRHRDLLRMGWLPILTAVAVALPWAVLIHLREPDFWPFFFWNEHIRRFVSSDAQHQEAFWFFFLAAPAMAVPWIFLVPAAAPGAKARLFEAGAVGRLLRLCAVWLALPFLFFSFSSGKLLTYILPCFPPFAVLTAYGLWHTLKKGRQSRLFQGATASAAGFCMLLLLAFAGVQLFGIKGFRPYSQPWKAVMVVDGLLFLALFYLFAFRSRSAHNKLLFFGLAPLFLYCVAHFTIPDLTLEKKSPGPFIESHRPQIAAADVVISDIASVTAVCWYLKRDDVYLLNGKGELGYGLDYPDGAGRLVDLQAAARLIEGHRGRSVLISRAGKMTQLAEALPGPEFREQSGPSGYALWKF